MSVTGHVSGSKIALSFNGGTKEFGTLTSGGLTIDFPNSKGILAAVAFSSATANQYNRAVTALQTAVATANRNYIAQQDGLGTRQIVNLCGSNLTTCPHPPAVPADYAPLVALDAANTIATVNFSHRPLLLCYAIAPGAAVTSLSYTIGHPIAPDALFSRSSATPPAGCVRDPGNDTGSYPVEITTTGYGQWVVQIDQRLPTASTTPTPTATTSATSAPTT